MGCTDDLPQIGTVQRSVLVLYLKSQELVIRLPGAASSGMTALTAQVVVQTIYGKRCAGASRANYGAIDPSDPGYDAGSGGVLDEDACPNRGAKTDNDAEH